jgi:hypothetical protein
MQLVAWTLACLVMWWMEGYYYRKLEKQYYAEAALDSLPENQPQINHREIPFFPQGVYGAREPHQGSPLRSDERAQTARP